MRRTRTAIVVTFAAAMGGVTAAGCGGSSTATETPPQSSASGQEAPSSPVADTPRQPPMNPPMPEPTCPPQEALHDGEACSTEGQVCYPRQGCGPNGFTCEHGTWHRNMTFCNPPRR